MTTLQWITGFLASTVSPLFVLPALIAIVWLVFAVRIVGRVHHVRLEDIPERGEEETKISLCSKLPSNRQ